MKLPASQGNLDVASEKLQNLINEDPRDFRPHLCQVFLEHCDFDMPWVSGSFHFDPVVNSPCAVFLLCRALYMHF
jgi:hypothetical protein